MSNKTYFIDIDGCLLFYIKDFADMHLYLDLPPLDDVRLKVNKWHCEGNCIVITTSRPESLRSLTEKQLQNAGIVYNTLLMNLGVGPRVLINDIESEDSPPKAIAVNVVRNKEGLRNVE